MSISRRTFLLTVPAAAAPSRTGLRSAPSQSDSSPPGSFPAQDPAVVREMVSVAHGNVPRVKELLSRRPALANAAWDWGYGDWETALGAASHVGNREIAALLLEAGARPTIFSAAALGQLDVVRAFVVAAPGVQGTRGPHGITLLAHAKGAGSTNVVAYLESLGGADIRYKNEPLTAEDRAAVVGSYTFGTGAAERLFIAVPARGGLAVTRQGGVERNLYHLGDRAFHPVGAPHVRLRFGSGAPAGVLTVEDGDLVVTARRVTP